MQWGEKDKFINLCTSLDGAAKQVLREMPTGGTTEEVKELLQTRFGTAKQAVSFEAQLHARRRKPKDPCRTCIKTLVASSNLLTPPSLEIFCRM